MTTTNPFDIIIRQNREILDRLMRLEDIHGADNAPPIPKYLRIEDIMEMTGWSRATIYGKTHKRELPVIKAGKRLLFPAAKFMHHMESLGRPVLTPKQSTS